jgi:RNA polymerase sigma-70 factor (ECF subfamily)
LIVVFRRLHTVTSPRAFPSWVFSVVRNTVRDRRREAFGRRWDSGTEVPAIAVETDFEGRDTLDQVWGLMDQLTPELREVLVLCDVEQRTDPEAAEILGVPVGTAKSRLRRARERLREAAEADGLSLEWNG